MRFLIPAPQDDVDESSASKTLRAATRTARATRALDMNVCSCGSDRAKSAKMPSGVDAWECLDCNCLQPKLIGGVTNYKSYKSL